MTHRGSTSLGFAVRAAAVILSVSAAHAQSYEQCQAEAGGIVAKLKICDATELDRRDVMLNQVYQQLLHAISPERQEKLREAERAWTAFVDAESNFCMSAETGGMDAPLVYNGCRLQLGARRIEDLQKALKIAQF